MQIYNYLDYRRYLGDFYHSAKKKDAKFSYRLFSQKAGVKAPNFLQWLVEGKRNLALKTIPNVCRALGLNKKEADYFKLLVQFNQAQTVDSKSEYFLELTKFRQASHAHTVTQAQYEHYSNWYSQAIREILNFHSFDPGERYSYRKLGKLLAPAITESEARKAVKKLLDLGLLRETKNGKIEQSDKLITTGDEVNSLMVRKYHQTVIEMAKQSLDRFKPETRDISGITMSISEECFGLIKKEIQTFRKRIMDIVEIDKKPKHVYQMNFQLYPMSEPKKAA